MIYKTKLFFHLLSQKSLLGVRFNSYLLYKMTKGAYYLFTAIYTAVCSECIYTALPFPTDGIYTAVPSECIYTTVPSVYTLGSAFNTIFLLLKK